MERDDLHREVYRTQGKLTSCFGYDAMGRKAWQFASTLPADKLSQVHNLGINTSLQVEHAYNPIHRRYQYDPAGELVRTLDKLRGEIKYQYEANGQLRSRDASSPVTSEAFRYEYCWRQQGKPLQQIQILFFHEDEQGEPLSIQITGTSNQPLGMTAEERQCFERFLDSVHLRREEPEAAPV